MQKVRHLFTEALNPVNKVANSIIKKLNYIESKIILKAATYEEVADFMKATCDYHSNAYGELQPEVQEQVAQRVWSKLHEIIAPTTNITEDTSNLEEKIYEFLKANGGILYPLELSAKKLANYIKDNK